ncbi:hypothetical protein OpiT1DRAFT_05699 [Opitutaceae bacterium TAV1]|nr:hypothetical protein OpiT1DRAFT_05699 [Opitutaceae bacterium TAV1]
MTRYTGVYVTKGTVRNVEFEAADAAEAQMLARLWNVGLVGEAAPRQAPNTVPPEAFNVKDTCRMLGNVSRTQIYRWVATGELDRVPDTARVLITRESIQRRARR